MIKKIGAILLALVLSLSVVVLPVSALEVTGDNTLAFELKWDKEYYKAGDKAVLSVYMKGAEGIQIHSGALMIGFDSTQIVELANGDADTIKSNWIASDLYTSCWKGVGSAAITLFPETNTTVGAKVESNSTSEEAEKYNYYQKIVIARDTSTEIGGNSKAGVPTEDLNALTDAGEPLLQFVYTIADGVADGTKIVAGIPSGSAVGTTHTQFKKMKSPGTATTTETIAPATFDLSAAVAEATVGKAIPEFTINQGKDAIRFNKNADNSYKNISIRTTAEIAIADLQGACDGKTANDDVEKYITEAGFVYIPTTFEFSVDAAKAAIDTIKDDLGESNNYTKKKVSYIQKTDTSYKYICVVDVEDNEIASAAFNTFAYICLDFDGDGTADKTYYYEAANSVSAKTLYNAKYEQANSTYSTYGWTLAAK